MALKLLIFNAAIIFSYFIIINLFKIPIEDMGMFGKYASLVMLFIGNIAFVLYDFALKLFVPDYESRLRPVIKKILK